SQALQDGGETHLEARTIQAAEEFRAALKTDGVDEEGEADRLERVGQGHTELADPQRDDERAGHAAETEPLALHTTEGVPQEQGGEERDLRRRFQDVIHQLHGGDFELVIISLRVGLSRKVCISECMRVRRPPARLNAQYW